MPSSDHTPRGHAARYTPECYDGMRDDAARTAAYRAAITAAAQGKVVVDLGTGALALLAVFAAEAGAKHVYAIEVQAAAAAAWESKHLYYHALGEQACSPSLHLLSLRGGGSACF